MNITTNSVKCFKCNHILDFSPMDMIGRQEECPSCYQSLHCCKMCYFYDTTSYNECKEPMANRVLDKEKANFCDFFKLGGGSNNGPDKNDLLDAANSLFKN